MKCIVCNSDNREGARFCKACGAKFDLKCPSCGHTYTLVSSFCDECGYHLRSPKDYTPQFLRNKILKTRRSIEGELKMVTVLFADVVNSTAFTESLKADDIHQIMDGAFKILMNEIHKYEGNINQFTGDGIMALFGAPIAHENHAQRACYAALSIQRALKEYRKMLRGNYGIEFEMRMGMDSGRVMVGAIGDDLRMDYTADGHTTILAKRLESIAETGTIMVSENTYCLIKPYFKFKELPPMSLKGIKDKQHAFLLFDVSGLTTRFEKAISKGLTRFVGRKNSMGLLRETWSRAIEGTGQVIEIMGEAGVGKSRLLFEFKESLVAEDVYFFGGRCPPQDASISYLPFRDILKSYFSITEGRSISHITKQLEEKLTSMSKEFSPVMILALQQLLSGEIADETWNHIEPKKRMLHIFEALKHLFITISLEKPVIIAIDDLQWMDKTSREFLDYFVESIAHHPILVVLLYRPEYVHTWTSRTHYKWIGLGHLTKESSIELISALLEDVSVNSDVENLILRKSAGNPLFIEELTYALLESHIIEPKNNEFVLVGTLEDIEMPDTIYGIIASRIDRLDDMTKFILQTASVIGETFDYRILQAIADTREELKPYLEELQHLEFIYEKELFPELEYVFRHGLIQEVAYESLPSKQRVELHKRIGSQIERIYADGLEKFFEKLSYHFSLGENYPSAYKYLKLSGKKAEDSFSHHQAFSYFEKALETFEKLPGKNRSDEEKLDILVLMTRPIAMSGFPKRSLKFLKEGVNLAKKIENEELLTSFQNAISLWKLARGDASPVIKSFNEAEKIEDVETMGKLVVSIGYAYTQSCKYDKLIDISLRITRLLKKTGKEADFFETPVIVYSYALGLYGMALAMQGDFKKGKMFSTEGLNHAVKYGDKRTMAFNELQHAGVLVLKGDGKEALAHSHNAVKYSEDTEWIPILSQGWTISGYSYYLLGELNSARDSVSKGLQIQEKRGIEAMLPLHYWTLAMVLFDLGNLEEAFQYSKKSLELSIINKEKRYEGLSKIWIGRILGSKEKALYKEGEQLMGEGYEILKDLRLKPAMAQGHLYLGELYGNSGKKVRATEQLRKAKSMFEKMEMDYWTAKCQEACKEL